MIYKLLFDADSEENRINKGTRTIFIDHTNTRDIEYPGIKKEFFDTIIFSENIIKDWPNVNLYCDSKVSDKEIDYLYNVISWPIIHERVKTVFELKNIEGITYYPVKLIDITSGKVNQNYYLMYINNFIDGYDMDKSEYKYNEEYDSYSFLPHATYLKKDVCNQYDIFRCKRFVIPIFVSEKIKQIIEENQWIGFDLRKQKES